MRVRVGRTCDAPTGVVEDANARLAAIAPRHARLHWLYCYFEPGDWWEPVERLVIAEVVPRLVLAQNRHAVGVTGESLLDELEGPHPRAHAEYDARLQRLVYREGVLSPNITARQWQLFREIDGFAMPRWYVQGSRGGHARAFDPHQQRMLMAADLPMDPPSLGDLPWATVDSRTIDQLAQADRFRSFARAWATRTTDDVRAARRAAEREYSERMTGWLREQLTDVIAEIPGTIDLSAAPVEDPATQFDYEAALALEDDPADEYAQKHAAPRGGRILIAT